MFHLEPTPISLKVSIFDVRPEIFFSSNMAQGSQKDGLDTPVYNIFQTSTIILN